MKQDSSPVVSSYICEEPHGNNYHLTQPLVSLLAQLAAAHFALVSVDFTHALPLSAGQGQQKNITDYFRISQTQVGAGGMKNCRNKEKLLDRIFTGPDNSFSSVSTVMEISSDSCSLLEDEDFVPVPRERSRKRPLSTAAAGIHKPEHDFWGEPEKPMVLHREHSQIKQERSQIKQELDDMEIEPVPDAHYGLLGTRNWEVPQASIDELPVEVLRNIFAFLPVTDLYQNLSLVCRCWRDIVNDPLVRTAVILIWACRLSLILLLCSALVLWVRVLL